MSTQWQTEVNMHRYTRVHMGKHESQPKHLRYKKLLPRNKNGHVEKDVKSNNGGPRADTDRNKILIITIQAKKCY